MIDESEALRFFRWYGVGLNEWQRYHYSTEKLNSIAMHRIFDLIGKEILSGEARRLGESHYEVSRDLYEYMKQNRYLEIAEENGIKIEEVGG